MHRMLSRSLALPIAIALFAALPLPASPDALDDLKAAAGRARAALSDFSTDVTGWRFLLRAPHDARLPAFDDPGRGSASS